MEVTNYHLKKKKKHRLTQTYGAPTYLDLDLCKIIYESVNNLQNFMEQIGNVKYCNMHITEHGSKLHKKSTYI